MVVASRVLIPLTPFLLTMFADAHKELIFFKALVIKWLVVQLLAALLSALFVILLSLLYSLLHP